MPAKSALMPVGTELLKEDRALELLIPQKKHRGDILISNNTFSTFFSSIGKLIECFFQLIQSFN